MYTCLELKRRKATQLKPEIQGLFLISMMPEMRLKYKQNSPDE